MAQTKPRKHLVPLDTAAEYLNVSPLTVRRMIAAGRITAYRLGKRTVRVDLNAIDASLTPIPATSGGAA